MQHREVEERQQTGRRKVEEEEGRKGKTDRGWLGVADGQEKGGEEPADELVTQTEIKKRGKKMKTSTQRRQGWHT